MYDKTNTSLANTTLSTVPSTVSADIPPAVTPPKPASDQDKAVASTLGYAGGAASGVATGVAIGAAAAGPIGAAVGGVIGAVAGAAGGKALVDAIGPASDDDAYWSDAYVREPYYRAGRDYDWYRPAYEHGWSGVNRYQGSYEEVESRLAEDWLRTPGRLMDWEEARPAVRSAWERAASRRATYSHLNAVNPATGKISEDDDKYWSDAYAREPYYRSDRDYSWYRPAFEHGWNGAARYEGSYDEVESRLADDWQHTPNRTMDWDEARPAVRSAWERAAARRRNMQTQSNLNQTQVNSAAGSAVDYSEAVKVLDDLLVMSRDGEEGFQHAANNVDTPYLKDILTRLSRNCATAVIQLQAEVQRLGGEPSLTGSVAGALHRGWTSVKTLFSSNDDETVLNDCVRAEEVAYSTFSEALSKPLPAESHALVQRHTEGVQRNLAEVRSLQARSRSA